MTSAIAPRSIRRAAGALLVVAALGVGGCGIKSEQVLASGATSTVAVAPSTTPPTTVATTTTEGGAFTLPSIPPDQRGTTPASTTATTSSAPTTSGADRRTPGGLTIASFASELAAQTQLTAPQAQCVAQTAFADFTDSELDQIYAANDSSSIPALAGRFTQIVQTCVAGH